MIKYYRYIILIVICCDLIRLSLLSICSLCNTKAISQQTLLLHAEGKKHRAKARAFHAKQQPEQMEASALDTKALTENKVNIESLENKPKGEAKPQDLPKDGHVQINSEASNGDISSNKKRKLDVPVRDITEIQSVDDSSGKACNVVREDKAAFITDKEDNKRKIMWKKLIKAALKSVCLLTSNHSISTFFLCYRNYSTSDQPFPFP